MIWLLYISLVANLIFGLDVLIHVIHDKAFRTGGELLGLLATALLTPVNIIWLAQL